MSNLNDECKGLMIKEHWAKDEDDDLKVVSTKGMKQGLY